MTFDFLLNVDWLLKRYLNARFENEVREFILRSDGEPKSELAVVGLRCKLSDVLFENGLPRSLKLKIFNQ